jgi:hypothetical protein
VSSQPNEQRDAIANYSPALARNSAPRPDITNQRFAKSLRGGELLATRFRVGAPTGHVWKMFIETMNSPATDLSEGPPENRVDVDGPTFRSCTTGQALEGESVWLEVQDHLMST